MNTARLLVLALGLQFALSAQAIKEGEPAPALDAKLLDGKAFSLSAASGKVVIVNFWATWCEPCRAEMPALDAYYRRHRDEGFVLLAVSMDDPADDAKVREAVKNFAFPAAMAKSVSARAYGRIWRIPITFLIDRGGIVRKSGWFAESGFDDAALEATVTPLLHAR